MGELSELPMAEMKAGTRVGKGKRACPGLPKSIYSIYSLLSITQLFETMTK